ncbi:MAG: LacI family DNA-binding transcriptional regulator [Fimbriimonas sp.]
MAVTIHDVARASGVSTAAVSKVLHGAGKTVRVSEVRAALIRETADRLNYRPNSVARNLRGRKTGAVGLVFEHFGTIAQGPRYYAHLLDGIGQVLYANQFRLTILPDMSNEDLLSALSDGQLEGVVWCKLALDPALLALIEQCPIPIVAMNAGHCDQMLTASFVGCDNDAGIELAVEHLWELGHRKIAFANEVEEEKTPDCVARREAFVRSLQERGVGATMLAWDWHAYDFQLWMNSKPPETALICWTEALAGRVLLRSTEAGIRIPDQLSVVGFDSTDYCDTTTPKLSAIRQPIVEMAKQAATKVLNHIQGDLDHSSIIFPCEFDRRESTSTVRSSP